MLVFLGLVGTLLASDIVINEIMVNPDGADAEAEWIELYNRSAAPVSLAGWTLYWGTSSYGASHGFGSATIEPGEFYVLSGELVGGGHELASFSFGNAGSSADAVQLRDAEDAVIDTVIYGASNPDEWIADDGLVADSLAPKPGSGVSLARSPDGADSDLSADDFVLLEMPTMGLSNDTIIDDPEPDPDPDPSWGASSCEGAEIIKLNEVMVNPDAEGGDGGHEWVELFNAGTTAINLGGWSIESGKSGGYGNVITFDASVSLSGGEYLLVGGEFVPDTDVFADFDMGNAGSNADALRLLGCDDLVADTLIYGGVNDDGWVDDFGELASSLAPKPSEGAALARISDGYDTDYCAVDWVAAAEPTPGMENPYTEPVECVPGSSDIKINEFMANPDGTDGDAEWVELFNTGDETVSVDGWKIAWGKGGTYSGAKVFGVGTDIESGGYLLIGGGLVADVDVSATMDMGNASSNSDALQLVDCEDQVQDTVIYGGPNDDGWLNDEDLAAESMAPKPGDGKAIARAVDGHDTERSGDDFVIADSPSPGEANPYSEPVVCVPGLMDIKINELLPNPEGADAENEFIELFNPSDESVSLDGWGLASGTSSWPGIPKIIFPGGVSIPAGGFFVIGGQDIEEADYGMDEDPDMLGNSSKNPDGVRLVDCTGDVQDTVLYGKAGEAIEDFELLDDAAGVSMASMPRDGLTVGRIVDGVDTDDNAADFVANMAPTPGTANAEAGVGGGEAWDSGCGCGKSAGPGSDAPPAEASTVGAALFSLFWLIGLRRRDD